MKYTILTSLLVAPFLCLSQTLNSYTDLDGLPSSNCRDVKAVGNDTVWIATSAGVSVFDGTSFAVHNTTTHPGLADNSVNAIEVASDGSIWAGTDFGVSVFDGTSYTTYTTADGLGSDQIRNIKEAPNGDIWIGTINGATVYDGTTFNSYAAPDVPFGGVYYFAFDANGDVWMAGGLQGITIYDGSSFSYLTTADGLISGQISSIALDASQNRLIGTAEGITEMNSGNMATAQFTTVFTLPPPDTLNPVVDVAIDSQGNYWAGIYVDYLVTEGGVSYYYGTTWNQFEPIDGLAGPNVRRISIDADDHVWVATSTGLTEISDINIGIEEIDHPISINVYPNPADQTITLSSEEYLNDLVNIFDAQGRLVHSGTVRGLHVQLNVGQLHPGYYVLHIREKVVRVMIER